MKTRGDIMRASHDHNIAGTLGCLEMLSEKNTKHTISSFKI